jgi:DNA-binding Lrp family transcriptional regulator
MDKIDWKILAELDKNLRIYTSKLARKCRVSQQVADYRIRRLLENGLITKFGTIVNLKALGQEHYRVFLLLMRKNKILISL